MTYTVKAVADIAGVSVRTLHHYDEIGLLKPAAHTAARYRLYGDRDLERLQQVLFFKELGFDLKEIKRILSDPHFDRSRALVEHRKLLIERRERIRRLIRSVDRTLKAIQRGQQMSEQMFDGFDAARYEEEARQRWGNSAEFEESIRRTKAYTKQDWAEIQREAGEIVNHLAPLMGRDPADPAVQQWIARHHRQINDRFYTCSAEVYRGLADMYVADPRFAANYERVKPGLTEFMRAAMHVYADALERKA
jgi:DNA-binding transcriptional MerR regulator